METLAVETLTSSQPIPNILGYARVSTADQNENGLSIDVQKTKILEKVGELGGNLAEEIFVDGGRSGTNMNRPGLTALLARCTKGDITHLVVQDTSRISRDTKDYLSITALLKKQEVAIVALSGMQTFGDDPYSQFLDEVIAAVNALHPRVSGYKARQTAVEKFKAGHYPSWAPVGYKNDKNPYPTGKIDQRIVVIDKEKAPFITQAFKMYATGEHSIFTIREYLHNSGVRGQQSGRQLAYSLVHNILKNPFYYGFMRWGGMEALGKHEPIIDKKTFDAVQYMLSKRGENGTRTRKHNFLLRGVIFCNLCGRRYTAEWHYNEKKLAKRGGKIGYYHCAGVGRVGKCRSTYVEIEELEKLVEQEVAKLEFTQEFIDAVKRNIRKVYESTNERVKIAKKGAYNRRDALEIKRERLEEELLEGTLARDRFVILNAKIDADMVSVQKELADINKIRTIDVKIIDEVLALTQDIATTYNTSGTNAQRAYLHFFFNKIQVENKKIVNVEYQPVIDVLNKAKLGILDAIWLRGLDSNQEPAD